MFMAERPAEPFSAPHIFFVADRAVPLVPADVDLSFASRAFLFFFSSRL